MTCSLNKFCANSLKEVVTAEVRKCFLTRIVLLVELPLETWLCEKSFFRKEAQTHIGNLQTDNISGTASPSKCFSTFSAFYCPWPLSVIAVGMDSLSLLPFIWPIFLPVIPLTVYSELIRLHSSFGVIYYCQAACAYCSSPIYWPDLFHLPRHSSSVRQMLCFTFFLLEATCMLCRLMIFPSDLIFTGCRETGAVGIDTDPRRTKMRLHRESQMLLMNSWSRFILGGCSLGILPWLMSPVPW